MQTRPVLDQLEDITTAYVKRCIFEYRTKHKVCEETRYVIEYAFQTKLTQDLDRIDAKLERINKFIHLSASEGRMAIMDIFANQLKKLKAAKNIKNEVEVKVVKKDTKKEQTRNANKAQSDKKAEKAAYEKQCVAAAIIKAAQEQKKKAKKQAKK